MTGIFWAPVAAVALMVVSLLADSAAAQKPGGVLRIYHQDSPASMSIHEEATYSTVVPMMGVFNNLVMYRQDVAQNSLDTIVPDLATQWSWSKDETELTFKLIALAHYLDSDATWTSETGDEWSISRLIEEEIQSPIIGAACGGTHRLMGLSYAVRERVKHGLDGFDL